MVKMFETAREETKLLDLARKIVGFNLMKKFSKPWKKDPEL